MSGCDLLGPPKPPVIPRYKSPDVPIPPGSFIISVDQDNYHVGFDSAHVHLSTLEQLDSMIIASGGPALSNKVVIVMGPKSSYGCAIEVFDILKADSVSGYNLISAGEN